MQTAALVQKPSAAVTARRARRAAVVCAAQQPAEGRVPRRALAALLAAAPALLPASRALALLPDDDDEELINKAKANRKARLAEEKAAEAEFKRSGGYVSRCAGGGRGSGPGGVSGGGRQRWDPSPAQRCVEMQGFSEGGQSWKRVWAAAARELRVALAAAEGAPAFLIPSLRPLLPCAGLMRRSSFGCRRR